MAEREKRVKAMPIVQQVNPGITRANYATMKQWSEPATIMKDSDDGRACQICFKYEKDTLILPCAHFFYCHGCVIREIEGGRDGCPTCQQKMSSFLRTHH
jgi:hypothetical protein